MEEERGAKRTLLTVLRRNKKGPKEKEIDGNDNDEAVFADASDDLEGASPPIRFGSKTVVTPVIEPAVRRYFLSIVAHQCSHFVPRWSRLLFWVELLL